MQKKYFSRYREALAPLPYLIGEQVRSYRWLLDEGLKDIFEEFSSVKDYSKDLELSFVDYIIEEPAHDEHHARVNDLTYEAPLRVKVHLKRKSTGEEKTQEIFFADFPLMTNRASFIINGVERTVVSQLARSSGVYFNAQMIKGRRFFGAKIIPNRGVWLEFETDPDFGISVKMDRKRKIPVTSLLRIFGFTPAQITERLSKIDTGERSYLRATLEKDPVKTKEDAYIEIYKRLRPGEMATVDNAEQHVSMLFSEERYDLSPVGRFKFQARLGHLLPKSEYESRVITGEDILAIVHEIIRKNNTPLEMPDDIDHLGNRRVRGIGELLAQRLRLAMTRIERNSKDRMSTLEPESLTPVQIVNARPFMSILKEFFNSSQLSQFMDQVNILSELEQRRRLSAFGPGGLTRERASIDVRDVHPSHYGKICPIETPEGPNIGLVGHLASYARLNDLGFIETPYRRVTNGIITDEIVYFTAFEEEKHVIAHAGIHYTPDGNIVSEQVEARLPEGRLGIVPTREVEFIDVAPHQAFSVATGLIPFLEHDDANRALMGSNMQRQAVPCLNPEWPRVATGMEERAARDSGRMIVAEEAGTATFVDATRVVITPHEGRGEHAYDLRVFGRSNQDTVFHHRPLVAKGSNVKKGDVLADNSSTSEGALALGKNIRVAFLPWRGWNYEDAIVISERLVRDDVLSSLHIEEFTADVRDTKLGSEVTTNDIPNVGEEKLKDLDGEGIVRVGAEVREGDILVGKITPKGESDLTPEERLLRAIFGEKSREVKDTSLRLSHGRRGRVISVRVFSRSAGDRLEAGIIKRVRVEVAGLRKIQAGDKIAGRHGNKGVVAKILREEDMPYLEDGSSVDMILSPLGVASRMNIGQILETHLGWAAERLGYQAITPALQGVTDEEIKKELATAGLPRSGKVKLFDGVTGEPFDQDITVGVMYMLKLAHMVEDKMHMRSTGPYSLITQQPLGGKAQGGGQRFGEMEVWALEGYGAAYTLQEMITVKSDDVIGRTAVYDAIVRGERLKSPHVPASFHVLVSELKGLALNVIIKERPRRYEEHESEGEESGLARRSPISEGGRKIFSPSWRTASTTFNR